MAETMPVSVLPPAALRAEQRKWLALATALAGSFMAFFDVFVVNVAIPTVQRDLHATFAQVQFVITGYSLTYAVTLITGGRLGDIFGRKRLFMLGMAAFTCCSALCGLAPSPGFLIAARVVQGLSAALMTPQVLSIIQVTFAPQERGRALGIFGAVFGFAATAGQVVGGFIVRADLFGLSWRPVFLINVPIGVASLAAATLLLSESRSATALRLDIGGVCLLTVGLFLLTFPLIEGREAGWPAWTWLCLLASLPVMLVFATFERRKTARDGSPLVVLRLFRQRAFVAGLLTYVFLNASAQGFLLTIALSLQIGLHFSSLAAGLVLGPAAIGFAVAAALSVRLVPRFGARLMIFGSGLMIAALGAATIVVALGQEKPSAVALALFVCGVGFGNGLLSPPLMGAILAGVDRDDAGAGSGVLVTSQQIGGAMGVAIIGVILFGALAGLAPRMSADLVPAFSQQLTAAGMRAADIPATAADFRACADDRARSHDPAIDPASCRRPALQTTDPPVAAVVGVFLQRANARNYAHAAVVSDVCALGFIIVAFASVCILTAPRR